MDRHRLATLISASGGFNGAALGLSLIGWFAPSWIDWWAVVVLGVLFVVALVVLWQTRPRPVTAPTPRRRRDDAERAAVLQQALRGQPLQHPLHGPTPGSGDIEGTRRNLWSLTMQTCWQPLLAASWAIQYDNESFGPVMRVGSVIVLAVSLVGLSYIVRRQRRLDRFEDTLGDPLAPDTPALP